MILRLVGPAALLSFFFLACVPLGPGLGDDEADTQADGAVCDNGNQCKSGSCLHDLCAGSGGCEGDGDCQGGWRCVHVEGSSGIFTSSPDREVCKPLCTAGCPEHHVCDEGDTYCRADASWSSPRVTVTPAEAVLVRAGDKRAFHAEATSPAGATDLTFLWTFSDADGTSQHVTGQDIELTAHRSGSAWVATVTVTDGKNRRGTGKAELVACGEAGAACFSDSGAPCCGALTCQSFACK